MAGILARESRVPIFLTFLIILLVLVNSQSLQLSNQSRALLTELHQDSARATARIVAEELAPLLTESPTPAEARELNERLRGLAEEYGLRELCVLDWNARLLSGGGCAPSAGLEFDRLDRSGRMDLLERGWSMTGVAPVYDTAAAQSLGYLLIPESEARPARILRITVPAPRIAVANGRFRTTLIYQISALTVVLLAVVLFLNSLLAPHRRLVVEARTVANELSSGPTESDEEQFLLTTFQEVVTRLKQKERELAALHQMEKARADETEARASDIIRSMTTGLVSLDPSGAVELVNPTAERIFGIRQDEVRGSAFAETFPGSAELLELVRRALEERAVNLRGQLRYRRSEGGEIHLGVSVLPLLTPGGELRGALCLLADLTEVIELRERLFLKDNLARLGEMAAGIAHEFRNGLATILGNAKLLGSAHPPDSEEAQVLQALVDECRSLSRVVSEFLQFARPEPLKVERIDLAEVLAELIAELEPRAKEADVRIRAELLPAELEADDLLLRKAISNLILNAIEAIDQSNRRRGGEVVVACRSEADAVTLRVADDGPGVPPESRDRLFTPFFTGKAGGTGLGLSVVQKIVISHNGTIELESPPVGASFLLRLPRNSGGEATSPTWI